LREDHDGADVQRDHDQNDEKMFDFHIGYPYWGQRADLATCVPRVERRCFRLCQEGGRGDGEFFSRVSMDE
jgi:hypothetical protein